MKILKKMIGYACLAFTLFFVFNAFRIYHYSDEYFENQSDVAIVLGAGISNNELSPVFKERVNHGIYLIENELVEHLILTGGYGNNNEYSDSEIAQKYVLDAGISPDKVHIEKNSQYTFENLQESKKLMDSLNLETALIVSDPIHMKRSIEMAETYDIQCLPSPTQTSMYRSGWAKFKFLMYETFYYTLGKLSWQH
jgi:uncharacterized SAM-binding protein YcdF (DUF218 family)